MFGSDSANITTEELQKESFESPPSSRNYEECPSFQLAEKNLYPGLALVYNGKCLNIHPELIHSALSGISIKHYYGKCELTVAQDEADFFKEEAEETYGFSLFGSKQESFLSLEKKDSAKDSTDGGKSFAYKEDSLIDLDGKPICTQYKINFRNSFWNLHHPELCKLTWPQKYVSTATVTDHLHEHLVTHGTVCEKYHEEKDRIDLLNKELDEYGRLKMIASPRALPADEKLFNFKMDDDRHGSKTLDARCKSIRSSIPKSVIDKRERFIPLNDNEAGLKEVHRSKEEFCLTIGKPSKKTHTSPSMTTSEQETTQVVYTSPAEEEGGILFYYNWPLYEGEETYQEGSAHSTLSDLEPNIPAPTDNCPPLMMDDFCRAAAKADFSDLRCNPDL